MYFLSYQNSLEQSAVEYYCFKCWLQKLVMSSHFSANQYEDAFNPKKLKNWTVPRKHKERPSTLDGYTQIIANNLGHLKSNIPRSAESPWGTFMGTWEMPLKIPPARPSYTARSNNATGMLRTFKETSSLNDAVNGYKSFPQSKKQAKSPSKSPINDELIPSARPKTPSPRNSVTPKSGGISPASSIMSIKDVKSPSPRSTHTTSPFQDLEQDKNDEEIF